jgi:DHA2 family multidrug resistance protein
VVNVSLPHIQGSLSASSDEITWVLTSYMVATGMMTPVSAWLGGRVGLKGMMLVGITLFTLSSVLCGLSTSLPEMVLLRIVQGLTFAPIPPLAQAAMMRLYPPGQQGRAMALFSMATVAGPIIGPVVGGYITDNLSWRWCFYLNLPPGAVALLLIWLFMPKEAVERRRLDFLGFGSLAIAIGALQLFLDRGPTLDWFGSREICIEAFLAGAGFWIFLIHSLTTSRPLFDPTLARDRNFVTSTIIMFVVMMLLFGSVALMPLMMQELLGYPATTTGLVGLPRALVILAALQIVGRLDTAIDRRLLTAGGLTMLTIALSSMTNFDLLMSPATIVVAQMLQGVGQGFVTVPMTTLGLATIKPSQRTDASTVMNLTRNLGGAVGVSVMQAMIIANTQRMHASMASRFWADSSAVRAGLPAAISPATATGAAALNAEITRQASMIAYNDNFKLMVIATALCIPLLLLMRSARPRPVAA